MSKSYPSLGGFMNSWESADMDMLKKNNRALLESNGAERIRIVGLEVHI